MATPARRPDTTPGLPGPQQTARQVSQDPLEQGRDLGGVIVLLGALGSLILGWTLFSNDDANGMWAGYWNTLFCTGALMAYAYLRSTLPAAPGVALTLLCGLGLILTGALHDYDTTIKVIMISGGALIGIGGAAQAKS